MTTVTKMVVIDREPQAVFTFLADGANWPKFAIHNIFSAQPGAADDWTIETPRGTGLLRLKTNAAFGIVDHEFIDPKEGGWDVPARVVPIGKAAAFIATLTKPEPMTESAFQTGMALFEEELLILKSILETSAG